MSSALTFYFKEIFPTVEDFTNYLTEYEIVDISNQENLTFASYIYKILFRRYANSNVQYDTIEDFKLDFANILEDNFLKYQQQINLIKQINQLSNEDIIAISTALANTSNNPNTAITDPTQPIEFISNQAFTIARDNKLQAYLRAIQSIPTQLIDSILMPCVNLFKTILPKTIYVYGDKKE